MCVSKGESGRERVRESEREKKREREREREGESACNGKEWRFQSKQDYSKFVSFVIEPLRNHF